MQKLEINLENCYGIKHLSEGFEFIDQKKTVVIYAANGVMKTSFARTFNRISEGKDPEEKIWGKSSKYEINVYQTPDGGGVGIDAENIYVIEPYVKGYKTKDEVASTLLVDAKKKEEYDTISKDILDKKKALISQLQGTSGVPKSKIEGRILADFGKSNFFDFLVEEATVQKHELFEDVKYNEVFNPDIEAFLTNPDVISGINEYIKRYNKVLEDIPYYEKGVFNPTKASNVAQTLKTEKFFDVGNSVQLKDQDPIFESEVLINKLADAEASIINDGELKKIRELLKNKKSTKEFEELLEKTPGLLKELEATQLGNFKKVLWRTHLDKSRETITALLEFYKASKKRLLEIEEEAAKQEGAWHEVVHEFRNRFPAMPFELHIEDQPSAVLGKNSPHIVLKFASESEPDPKFIERSELDAMRVLSQGEERALYLLNILFEVKSRKQSHQEQLFIVDDIADSFDYKNKYAIIEYLEDNSKEMGIYQIILTHNFDFFRTINSRILSTPFVAQRDKSGVITFLKNDSTKTLIDPFTQWRATINMELKIMIAAIPFARNITQYKDGNDEKYLFLTHLLHHKEQAGSVPKTTEISLGELEKVYQDILKNIEFKGVTKTDKVITILLRIAAEISTKGNSIELILEDKIILAMAIRLMAENYMIKEIAETIDFKGTQTRRLFNKFCKKFQAGKENEIKILERVNIMTPESIHLNSFMYEPILDMSIEELVMK